MALAAQQAQETVRLQHQYNATIEQVFSAWSDPNALGQWFGPHSHNCKVEKYDFTVGGHIPDPNDANWPG